MPKITIVKNVMRKKPGVPVPPDRVPRIATPGGTSHATMIGRKKKFLLPQDLAELKAFQAKVVATQMHLDTPKAGESPALDVATYLAKNLRVPVSIKGAGKKVGEIPWLSFKLNSDVTLTVGTSYVSNKACVKEEVIGLTSDTEPDQFIHPSVEATKERGDVLPEPADE